MSVTQTEKFTPLQQDLAELAKLLSSPTRIAILEYLLEAECCICRDLTEFIGFSQPTISKHIAELRAAGLIVGEAEGTTRKYRIDISAWKAAQAKMQTLLGRLPGKCCV